MCKYWYMTEYIGRPRWGEVAYATASTSDCTEFPFSIAPNVGAIEKGVVTRLEPYGAFVQLQAFRGRGLVHRSQLGGPLGVNDEVFVKVIDVTMERDDRSGNIHQKISLSTKNIDQETLQ